MPVSKNEMNQKALSPDPLSCLSPQKRELVTQILTSSQTMDPSSKMTYFLSAAKRANENHIEFSNEEIASVIDAIRQIADDETRVAIDQIISTMDGFGR